jgi:hypothetical protein
MGPSADERKRKGKEMKEKRARYQNGSIRRIARATGFAWEVRFSEAGATGQKNKYRSLYFSGAEYPTETDLRKAPAKPTSTSARSRMPCIPSALAAMMRRMSSARSGSLPLSSGQ